MQQHLCYPKSTIKGDYMFEVYDWVEYNGNPARIMNKKQ